MKKISYSKKKIITMKKNKLFKEENKGQKMCDKDASYIISNFIA